MESLNELISKLDLNLRELAEARELFEGGDTTGLLGSLIAHFRGRDTPRYLFDENDVAHFRDDETIAEAEQICRHHILGYDLGEEIDWRHNATEETFRDPEWMWSLSRHIWWITLGRAYQMTGDEKYAGEFVAELKGFVKAWPVDEFLGKIGTHGEGTDMSFPGTAWRTIETAIRIYAVWLPLFIYFRRSRSWDEEGWILYLNSIHDHAELLSAHYTNHTRCSNWHTMESSALFQLGVMFPEFKRSKAWKRLGYRRVAHEVRYQFDHHGVHMERTPVYQLTASGAFLQAYRIAVLNDIPVPPYMLPILEKSAEFFMRLVKPDFTTPMFGDADRNSLLAPRRTDVSPFEGMNNTTDPYDLNETRAFFRVMAELTGREDFRYFGSGRKQGREPKQKCFCMADPGFYIFRTGWKPKDSCFMITGTNLELGESNAHSHYDAGHLELQVEGEDVLIDTGRYIYGNSGLRSWRNYFHSSGAHNTVQVDDHDMGEVPDWPSMSRGLRTFCHRFESTKSYEAVEVSHNGYAFMEDPVFHLRRVIYIKPAVWLVDDVLTGFGEHEYRLYFNFAPGSLERLKGTEKGYRYLGKRVRVRLVPLWDGFLDTEVMEGQEEPMGGWASYGYVQKVAVPRLTYRQRGPVPVRFVTAVIQEGKGAQVRLLGAEAHAVQMRDFRIEVEASGSEKRKPFSLSLDLECFRIQQNT